MKEAVKKKLHRLYRNVNKVVHKRLWLQRPWIVTKLVVTDANCDITKGQFLMMCAFSTRSEGKKLLFSISAEFSDKSEAVVVGRNNEFKGPLGPSKGPHVENHSTALCWRKPFDNCRACRAPLQSALCVSQPFKYQNPTRSWRNPFSMSPLFFLLSFY